METLYRCDRCKLLFGWEGVPELCPACMRRISIKPRIELAGRDVTEFVLRSTREAILADTKTGLRDLKLGHCPHGCITSVICTDCI